MVGEESEQLHLSDLWSFAQQSFAFSRVVRFEEEVEKEAPVFGSERVAAAWLASHQARRGHGHGLLGHHVFVKKGLGV